MLPDDLHVAWKQTRASRSRTALVVLAIALGTMAIVVLTSLGQSALISLTRGIEAMGGTRVVLIWPDAPQQAARRANSYTHGLTLADARALRARIPGLASVAPIASRGEDNESVRASGNRTALLDVLGADESYLPGHSLSLAAGRGLVPEDLDERRKVCVLGNGAARQL